MIVFVLAEERVEFNAEVGGFDLVECSKMRGDVTFCIGKIISLRRDRGLVIEISDAR